MYPNEAEKLNLDWRFAGTSIDTTLYVGLCNRGVGAEDEADDMTAIGALEMAGTGYARVAVANGAGAVYDMIISQVGGDWQAKTPTCTFTAAGGTIGPFTHMFLTNKSDNSGKLMNIVDFGEEISITDTKSFECSIYERNS